MSITINDNFKTNAPKDIENRSGVFSGGAFIPYADVASANAAILSAYRFKGLTVRITEGSGWALYWYRDGILDANLVKVDDYLPSVTYTANQAASASDLGKLVFLDSTSSGLSYTIAPATFANRMFRIYGIVPGANIISITPTTGTINGNPSYELLNQECITVYSNGTNLFVIGKN